MSDNFNYDELIRETKKKQKQNIKKIRNDQSFNFDEILEDAANIVEMHKSRDASQGIILNDDIASRNVHSDITDKESILTPEKRKILNKIIEIEQEVSNLKYLIRNL